MIDAAGNSIRKCRSRLALILVAAFVLPLALSGCAGKSDKDDLDSDYVEQPVEQIYDVAFKLLQRKRYTDAAKVFDEVERQHPYSVWARRAMLMSAFSYYQANKYDDAVESADRFLALHPGNRDAPYAYYLKAICYYEQISDVGRDQEKTLQALNALQEIARRYPGSEYARDAHLKIDLTRDHLAGKEMYIGRYYLKHAQYVAAISRFKNVIETYQTTSHVPEALHRLTEAYFALGLNDEAQAAAAVLGYNFPDSSWYKYSYALLTQRGLEQGAARPQQASLRRIEPQSSQEIAPPADAGATEDAAAPVPRPTTPVERVGPGEEPAPPSGIESPPSQAAQQAPAATPASRQAMRNLPSIDRPYTDEDLKDSWVRRVFRSLF